jgi:hypothetical protein
MRANASSAAASSVAYRGDGERSRAGQALRRLCQLRPVEIEQRQRRPFLGEALRNRGPDAVGGTSDNDKFVLHAIHARRLLGLTCKANQAGCGGHRRAALG